MSESSFLLHDGLWPILLGSSRLVWCRAPGTASSKVRELLPPPSRNVVMLSEKLLVRIGGLFWDARMQEWDKWVGQGKPSMRPEPHGSTSFSR